ncbi:MAG: hypothetical protein CVU07_13010 [Bacteroidetes bacterium HGW-Bacteroidetes-23]|nr:MAG: hypothetical protein CVU07_13010 [Bacteroidetes bacterium HGW-Bacteroidetes-23]
MAGLVINSTAVLLLNICAKLNICASNSATSPSCKTLPHILKADRTLAHFVFPDTLSFAKKTKRAKFFHPT